MADGQDRDQRTERATERKREDARRKGQVVRSREVQSVAVLAAILGSMWFFGEGILRSAAGFMTRRIAEAGTYDLNAVSLRSLGVDAAVQAAAVTMPMLLAALIAGVGASVAQVGWLVAWEPVTPDIGRLNPLNGMKKYFSLQGLTNLAKTLLQLSVLGWVLYGAAERELPRMMELGGAGAREALIGFGGAAGRTIWSALWALLAIAAADYAAQRFMYERSLRMTKQEVLDERKQQEGNPKVKARIRSLQREAARKRMMRDVPKADVVITNPTHYAVALRYREEEARAPKVLAKGRGYVALRIREIAAANRIAIVENPPLARSLYKEVEVGKEIPEGLYKAVAEVLAYVYGLKGRRAARTRAEVNVDG